MTLKFAHLHGSARNIRLHGNRFIQLDLDDKGDERVHIWSDFVPHAQDYPTPIHNHVFGFESRIVAGTLLNVRYRVEPVAKGKYKAMTYHTYGARTRDRQDTVLEKVSDQQYLAHTITLIPFERDSVYTMLPLEFHATGYIGFAITRLHKTETAEGVKPTVLCPVGKQPDNAFKRYQYTEDALWESVRRTLELQ